MTGSPSAAKGNRRLRVCAAGRPGGDGGQDALTDLDAISVASGQRKRL